MPSCRTASLPGLTLGRSEDSPQPLFRAPASLRARKKPPNDHVEAVSCQRPEPWLERRWRDAADDTSRVDLGRKRPLLTRRRTALLETCYSLSDLPVWLVCRLFSTIMLRLASASSVY